MRLAGSGAMNRNAATQSAFAWQRIPRARDARARRPALPNFPGKCIARIAVRSSRRAPKWSGRWLPSCVWRLVQNTIDDAAQDALRKTFSRGIDRRDSPKMDRYLFIVLDHLKLRMIHANSFSTQTRLAENNDALAGGDHFLHVMQIEPAAYQRLTQRIRLRFLQRGFKDFLPAAKSAQRRFDHLSAETDRERRFLPAETVGTRSDPHDAAENA